MIERFRSQSGQQGQAMVETALMILVVLLLLMGIIQFGFIFYAHVRVSNAAREGARAGSLWLMNGNPDELCDRVEVGVWSELPADAEQEDVTMEITLTGGPYQCLGSPAVAAGEPITVTVTYDYDLPVVTALPIIRDIIPSPYPVSRTVVMRCQ
jgi:hypothetical protein